MVVEAAAAVQAWAAQATTHPLTNWEVYGGAVGVIVILLGGVRALWSMYQARDAALQAQYQAMVAYRAQQLEKAVEMAQQRVRVDEQQAHALQAQRRAIEEMAKDHQGRFDKLQESVGELCLLVREQRARHS